MSIINDIMNFLFDICLFPFRSMHPVVGLTVLSVVLGIVLLLLFKYTSPQKAIKKVKNKIKAGLYEVRLYKDDLGVIFKANKSLLASNGFYIGCCCVPLIPMIIIILPVLTQLDARYGLSPLKQGDCTLLKVVLDEKVDFDTAEVKLEVPEGLKITAGPVRIPSKREYAYRMEVGESGHYDLSIVVNGRPIIKSIDAQDGLPKISPMRSQALADIFMYPAEPSLPSDAPLESVEVLLGRKKMLGMDGDIFPWLIIFCVVGLAAGLAMKGVFKVNI